MLTLGDRPLIQYAVEEARDAGIEEFIFISSKGKKLMEDHFKEHSELQQILEKKNRHIALKALHESTLGEGKLFVTHQDRPRGLGHAIWCAKNMIGDEPFAIILPDDVILNKQGCLSQMVAAYNENGGNIIAVENVPLEDTSKYGIVDIGNDNGKLVEIKGLVEKPEPAKAPSTLAIVGRYILQPEIITQLATFSVGSGGEIQLTDAMEKLVKTQPFYGLRFAGSRHDCGNSFGLLKANIALAMNNETAETPIREYLTTLLNA